MAHDSSLPPGSILLRTMPLIVPRYGGALLFMAVHARCSDRSSVLSLFSSPPLPLLLHIRNRGIKKKKKKNGKIEMGFDHRSRRLLEQMLSQFIFDDAKSSLLPTPSISFTYRKSLYLSSDCMKIVGDCRPISIREFGGKRKKGEEKSRDEKNWNRHHHRRKSSRTI